MIHHFHLMLGAFQKFRLGQVLKPGVPCHCEVGTIELKNKSRIDDGFVFHAASLRQSLQHMPS